MMNSFYGFQAGYDRQLSKLERLKALGAPEELLQQQERMVDGITLIDADEDGWADLPVYGKNGALLPSDARTHRFFLPAKDLTPSASLADALEMAQKLPAGYGFLVLSNSFCVDGVAGFLTIPPEKLGRNINETFATVDETLDRLPEELVWLPLGKQMLFRWGDFTLWMPTKGLPLSKVARKARNFLKQNRRELIFDLLVVPQSHLDSLPAGEPYLLPEDCIVWPTSDPEEDAA